MRVKAAPDVVSRRVGEELVLLDLRRGTYFGLDEIGSRFWSLLGEGGDLPSIATTIAAEYDASPLAIERDLHALVEALRAEGLVVE
jgi:hypothetical protein